MAYERAIALKVSINILLSGEFHQSEGEYKPNYIEVNGKKISRITVIGTVVKKEGFDTIIDDGTGEIALAAFNNELDSTNEGDIVRVIGKIREREGQRNLVVEAVQKVNNNHLERRRLELEGIDWKKGEEDIKKGAQNKGESDVMLQIEEMDVE